MRNVGDSLIKLIIKKMMFEDVLGYVPVAECLTFWLGGPYGLGALELRLTCRAGRDAIPKLPPAKYKNARQMVEFAIIHRDVGMVERGLADAAQMGHELNFDILRLLSAICGSESVCKLIHTHYSRRPFSLDYTREHKPQCVIERKYGGLTYPDLVSWDPGAAKHARWCICWIFADPFSTALVRDWIMTLAALNGHEAICRLAKEWGSVAFDGMLCNAASGGHEHICRLAKEWGATDFSGMLRSAAHYGQKNTCRLAKEWGADNFREMSTYAAEIGVGELARTWIAEANAKKKEK